MKRLDGASSSVKSRIENVGQSQGNPYFSKLPTEEVINSLSVILRKFTKKFPFLGCRKVLQILHSKTSEELQYGDGINSSNQQFSRGSR
jgi:hypothetical protein